MFLYEITHHCNLQKDSHRISCDQLDLSSILDMHDILFVFGLVTTQPSEWFGRHVAWNTPSGRGLELIFFRDGWLNTAHTHAAE